MLLFIGVVAVSGGLTLLQAICQRKIEYQVRKCCVKGLILRFMAGRESGVCHLYNLHESGYKKRMKKKQEEIRNALNLHKKICESFACDKLDSLWRMIDAFTWPSLLLYS